MTHWLLLQIVTLLQNHPFALVALCVLLVSAQWTVFAKAGQPGWAVLIPIYGQIVMARVAGKPGWMGLLLFLPFINVLALFALSMSIARRFGRGPLFGLGLTFASPIFTPILAFGGSRYRLYG
jgi:hypothetical protein